MSVHKVPQDVEAEDRLLWIFSFKQIIFLLIAGGLGFIMVLLARVTIYLAVIPLPLFLIFLFLGIYRRSDQPLETYVAAILRFWIKPRKRIWDRDGIMETVHITVPKKVEVQLTDNLSRNEVKNRLNVLGSLMDTRGWSAKNTTLQGAGAINMALEQSDRLVVPQMTQAPSEVQDADDIYDFQANPIAHTIDGMASNMQINAHNAAMTSLQSATAVKDEPVDLSGGDRHAPHIGGEKVISPTHSGSNDDDDDTSTSDEASDYSKKESTTTMTTDVSPDILKLSQNNDRNIESIAKEADNVLAISHDDDKRE